MNNKFDAESSILFVVDPLFLERHPYFVHIRKIKSYGYNQMYVAERYGKKWFLKGLKAEYCQQPLYVELLRKEFDILMSLSYPYIVQAFGVEYVPKVGPCIIMEFVDGLTLEAYLKKTVPLNKKFKIVDQLLEALQYVHDKQIVHRDLKPTNIIITHNGGNVKLIDFGLADSDSYKVLKQPAGTLRYMSPEQLQKRNPDVRNDIYSVGRILEDMKLGRSYAKPIRCCLLPLAQRYADVGELAAALHKVKVMRSRMLAFLFVTIFVTFFGYLIWQIQVIRQEIPIDTYVEKITLKAGDVESL